MKSKLIMKFLIVSLLTFSVFISRAQIKPADDKNIAMLKTFYTAYITELAGSDPDGEKKLQALRKKYCTPHALKAIDDLSEKWDADAVVKAQDGRFEDVKTIKVIKEPKPGNYTVTYGDTEFKATIHLAVIQQNGVPKIDNLW